VFSRTIVRLGAGARATLVERHVGDSEAFVCGTVEIELAPGAHLDYVVVQNAGDGARVIVHRSVRCADDAVAVFHVAELGGALVRSTVVADVAGARASAGANALFFARGFEHVDLRLDVALENSAAQTHSVIRSAASGRGQGRFTGALAIAPGTRACRASLHVDALVLSRDAYVEALPTLEIGANDVVASHAVRIGSLDEEQLFYVQSRGFARGSAERMIALAFFEPAIARFPGEVLRDEVRTALDERLDDVGETFES
jgi:Fe-S cluster assembly protein SufD